MKKILYIISYIPLRKAEGPQGPKNLTYNLLKYLSNRHELDLLILSSDEYDHKNEIIKEFPDIKNYRHFKTITGMQRSIFRLLSLIKGYPLSLGEYRNRSIELYIAENYRNYDIVHYDYFLLANLFEITCGKIPSLLYSHDAYSLFHKYSCENTRNLFYYLLYKIKELTFRHLERKFYEQVSKVVTVSDIDTSHLVHNNIHNVVTVPIPVSDTFSNTKKEKGGPQGLLIVAPYFTESDIFLAKEFISGYLDRIKRTCDFDEIVVWGKYILDFPFTKKYQDISFINYVEDYVGFLNRDWVYVYLKNVGSGMHTKLQEAMALGLPVVGFSNLLAPLGAKNGEHFFSCDSLDEIYNRIVELAGDPGKRSKMGRSAREFVRKTFDPEVIGRKIDGIYSEFLNEK
jgi:glycosyltransferase involved in cell wall biosynthesis